MYGWRAKIGFIYADCGKRDHDCFRMVPPGVSVHFTRVKYSGQVTLTDTGAMSETERLVEAARLLGALRPDCISWLDTSGSFMFEPQGDRVQVEALQAATGVSASTTSSALLAAFSTLGISRIAVATPYINELNEQLCAFLEANQIAVDCMRALELQWEGDISSTSDAAVYALAREAYSPRAEAVLIPCTDFASIDLIEPLERDLGVPVITANQASVWHALRIAGVADSVAGFGHLMALGDTHLKSDDFTPCDRKLG